MIWYINLSCHFKRWRTVCDSRYTEGGVTLNGKCDKTMSVLRGIGKLYGIVRDWPRYRMAGWRLSPRSSCISHEWRESCMQCCRETVMRNAKTSP
jgi:hypothetical protein